MNTEKEKCSGFKNFHFLGDVIEIITTHSVLQLKLEIWKEAISVSFECLI